MISHDHAGPYSTERQPLIDHMVTTHGISPTHFRDMNTFEEVDGVHAREHERRSGGERREDAAYNHPDHYGGEDNPYEAIKVIANWLGPEGLSAFCLGNAIKYISRAGKKDPTKTVEDLKKARWYLDYEIRHLDEESAARAHDIGG